MTKHTNPFYTINEATAVLRSLGADPLRNLPQSDGCDWRESILSVSVSRQYLEGGQHYFAVSIHIGIEGLTALLEIINNAHMFSFTILPERTPHTDSYDKLAVYLSHDGHLLEVMALVPKEESK